MRKLLSYTINILLFIKIGHTSSKEGLIGLMNVLLRLSKERKRKSMEYGNSTIKPKNEGKKKKGT